MNPKLNSDEYPSFCEKFLFDKKASPSSPICSQNSLICQSNSLSPKKNSERKIKMAIDTSAKLINLRNHVIHSLEKHNNKSSTLKNKKIEFTKGTTIFSDSKKKKTSKIYDDLKNLPPVLHNNLKMFINKIKRWGYLNDLSVLKPYDLKIINDHAYCELEEENDSFNFGRMLKGIFLNFTKIIEISMHLLHIKNLQIGVIHPYNKFKLFWDVVNSLMIIFLLFSIPLSLCFDLNILKNEVKLWYSMVLILDMLLEMNTLYFSYGLEVRDRKRIIKNYLTSYLLPDILGLFSIAFQIDNFNYFGNELCLLFFMKTITLTKVIKKMTNRFQLNHQWKGVKNLIYLFFVIVLITHLAACGWYYIGVSNATQNLSSSWIANKGLLNEAWQIQYMSSFYWSIVTVMTVGYGDIVPQNNTERCFCLFVILFGGMIFPFSINSIGLIIQDIQKDKIKFDNTLDIINAYMIRKNIKSDLQTRIREYLNFIWKEEKSQNMEEEKKIINSLSHSLKEELNLETFGFFLKNNPLFTKFFSESSLKKLVNVMKEIFLTPDDSIFLQNQKDENPAIYFIGKGNVNIYSEQTNKIPILIKELKEGDYFGERSFFTSLNRENTAISEQFTTLFMIRQEDFILTIKENKQDYENFVMIKEKLLFYNDYSSINKKCFSCQQFNHIIEECPKLHFVPNIEKIIKRYNYPFLNERNPFPRKINKFSNALLSVRKNMKNYQRFKTRMQTMKTKVKEEDEDSSSEISNEMISEENENEILNNESNSNEKDLYLNSISNSLGENFKSSITKTWSEDLDNKEISPKNPVNSKGSLKANDYFHKKNIESVTKTSKKEDHLGHSSKILSNTTFNQNTMIKKEFEFDRVNNFKNYFPKYNIENIIKTFSKTVAIEKEINKKYVKKKYRFLQNYTFYVNDILCKFLNEVKAIKKNRKSVNTDLTKTNTLMKKEKSAFQAHLGSNLFKKKNYFSKNDHSNKEIISFADLINTLIQKNKKRKIINKAGNKMNVI